MLNCNRGSTYSPFALVVIDDFDDESVELGRAPK